MCNRQIVGYSYDTVLASVSRVTQYDTQACHCNTNILFKHLYGSSFISLQLILLVCHHDSLQNV